MLDFHKIFDDFRDFIELVGRTDREDRPLTFKELKFHKCTVSLRKQEKDSTEFIVQWVVDNDLSGYVYSLPYDLSRQEILDLLERFVDEYGFSAFLG